MPNYGFKSEDIVKENRISTEEIAEIKQWAKTQKVPAINDEQIVSFILSCERNLDLAKNTIIEHYKIRKQYKELFNNRKLSDEDIQSQLQALEYVYFPKYTKTGEIIVYHKLSDTTYWKYKMETSMKLFLMTIDAAVYEYPPTGLIVLYDMKGVSLMHLTRLRIDAIKGFCRYAQGALPVKLKAVHVLNTLYFVDKVLAMCRSFLKPEIFNLIHFHPPSLNMEDFHRDCVEKDCLPVDLGGTLKSTAELHADNTKILEELQGFFDEEELERINFDNNL